MQGELQKGQQLIDDSTNTDDAKDYKLVMVGRKISDLKLEKDAFLREIVEGN